ncbi:pyridoxine 5'-phosphate synthase [Oscillatoria amoena NRMC-F 0135]|nr:pyridoxine 5'-phosphate synthase [Oscillatoria amoena NRMC-F 0135]
MIKLGVNIDHVATLRQARYARVPHSLPYVEPDIVEAARAAIRGGADGITIHLREDRRHIVDHDVYDIRKQIDTRLNLEMAHWPEIITLALEIKPDSVCLVPEKRQEVTTEGGLNLLALSPDFEKMITTFRDHGIQVSLFIDPDPEQIARAAQLHAHMVEFHTGQYATAETPEQIAWELGKLRGACGLAHERGLIVNAGHGINYRNITPLLTLPHLNEFNIGHTIVARALQVGMEQAVRELKSIISPAPAAPSGIRR